MSECEIEIILKKASNTNIKDLGLSTKTYKYIVENRNIKTITEILIYLSEYNGVLGNMDYDIELSEMKQELILKLDKLGFRLLENNDLILACRILLNKYRYKLSTTNNKEDLKYKISELNYIINELTFEEQLHYNPNKYNEQKKENNFKSILKKTLKRINVIHTAKIN